LEVLVAGGALLAVPAGLVDERDGSEKAEALDREGNVGEVGDGTMAVLEVEGVEKLLGSLRADFAERLAHGERGARVLGHGVGENFGLGAVDGVDFGGVLRGLLFGCTLFGWLLGAIGHDSHKHIAVAMI